MIVDRFYSAAMALNNMAVSLLDRGREAEAMEAFGDALILMRDASTSDTQPNSLLLPVIDKKLSKSSQRLARSSRSDAKDGSGPDSSLRGIPLRTMSEDLAPSEARKLTKSTQEDYRLAVFRLEGSFDTPGSPDECYTAYVCAMILSNCASAHLFFTTTSDSIQEGLSCAWKLLSHAYALLEKSSVAISGSCMATNDNILPLMLLVLRSLVYLSERLHRVRAEAYYGARYDACESAFSYANVTQLFSSESGASAA